MTGKSQTTSSIPVSFTDFDLTMPYDRKIAETKKHEQSENPCESLRRMNALITNLEVMKSEYYRRPCPEGWCFGLTTPHRSRLERRISAFRSEVKVFHTPNCQAYLREKESANKAELELKKEEMWVEAAKASKETITRRGYFKSRNEP
ncbi:MAG: hypothetical protein S4CHLAM7_13210 [Chlamydiae bacterium]|nr:hypothetical protein [Chlamydiota bacterium]